MKRICQGIIIAVALAIMAPAFMQPTAAQQSYRNCPCIIAESDTGFLYFEGNELTVGSKVNDPAKVRITAPIYADGGGGGVISFNRSREAGKVQGGGQQQEMGMLRMEQAEDVRGDASNLKAEFNFLVNDGSGDSDAAMVKPLAFTATGFTRFGPALVASLIALLVGFGAAGGVPSRFRTDHSRFVVNWQDDTGGAAGDVYDTWGPDGKPRPESQWSSDPAAFKGSVCIVPPGKRPMFENA